MSSPPNRAAKGERRRRILEVARPLFAANGFLGVTPQLLAETVGLKPSVLARVFPEIASVLAGIAAELSESLFPATETVEHSDEPLHKLNSLFERFRKEAKAKASPVRVALRVLGEPGAAEAMRDGLTETAARVADLVRDGQQKGVFRRSLDAQGASWELLRTMFGRALLEPVLPQPVGEEEHPAAEIDCLLHGLLKTDV